MRFVFAILLYSCATAKNNNDAKKSGLVLNSPQNITERELIVASDIKKGIGNCDLTGTLLLPAESPPTALAFFITVQALTIATNRRLRGIKFSATLR